MFKAKQVPPVPGTQFDCWTVIGASEKPYSVMCRCKCGKERSIRYRHLYSGHTRSCVPCSGDKISKARIKHSYSKRRGGRSSTYHSWEMMVARCVNRNIPS